MKMKYFAITTGMILICGVAGVSAITGVQAEEVPIAGPYEAEINQTDAVPVEYIEFDPYYIKVDLGKNEG